MDSLPNNPSFPVHRQCTACRLNSPALKSPGLPTLYIPSLPPTPTTPAVVFLGRNPSALEDNAGEAYHSSIWQTPDGEIHRSSGYLLKGDIANNQKGTYVDGINLRSLASIYITNYCRCASFSDEDKPKDKEYTACSAHLLRDLSTIAAAHNGPFTKLVLCTLGAEPAAQITKMVLGRKLSMNEAFKLSTNIFTLPTYPQSTDWAFFSFWQPAYLSLNQKLIHALGDHLEILSDYLQDLIPPISQPQIVPPYPPPRPHF